MTNLKRIKAIQSQIGFNARDGIRDEYAAANLDAGNAAWCSTASYSNALSSGLACAANRLGSIEDAQIELEAQFGAGAHEITALNTLIPLNNDAVAQLWSAYVRLGTFRTRDELIRRLYRYEAEAVSEANAGCADMRGDGFKVAAE